MMHPAFGVEHQGQLPMSLHQDAFLDDLSTQIALSQAARRLSRGSTGQRASSAMRVSKQSSANNSPRSSVLNRRRTMINDGPMPRRQAQPADYFMMGSTNDFSQGSGRSARPVSWHPSTHLQPQMAHYHQQAVYPLSTPSMHTDHQDVYSQPQFSPMMASYSNNTSPSSAFSPLPLDTFQGTDGAHYLPSGEWDGSQKPLSLYTGGNSDSQSNLGGNSAHDQLSAPPLDWNAFVMHGFNNTSPPTPELFLPTPQSQNVMPEEHVAYHSLDEPEEEGEILVGMGLYDTPEKYQEDPHLNNYRSTVSSLLGSTFRPKEPQGKGLKLEETWEPPKSDDEEEDENDEDSGDEDQGGETAKAST